MRMKYIVHSLALVVICIGLMGANPSPEACVIIISDLTLCTRKRL